MVTVHTAAVVSPAMLRALAARVDRNEDLVRLAELGEACGIPVGLVVDSRTRPAPESTSEPLAVLERIA